MNSKYREDKEDDMIYKLYIEMSNEGTKYVRKVATLEESLAKLGGLLSITVNLIRIFLKLLIN